MCGIFSLQHEKYHTTLKYQGSPSSLLPLEVKSQKKYLQWKREAGDKFRADMLAKGVNMSD